MDNENLNSNKESNLNDINLDSCDDDIIKKEETSELEEDIE